ncbi:MAG: glycosyltransferase family 4 protein [Firmicutes bacterium]|nr:glycosyltransferase family 4 protein [Bacillota bacterium]
MKNILYVNHESYPGGASLSLLGLIKNINKRKYKLFAVCPADGPFVDMLRDKEVEVRIIPMEMNYFTFTNPVQNFVFMTKYFPAVYNIIDYIVNKKIDLVHVNSSVNFNAYLSCRYTKKPLIWHVRELYDEGNWKNFVAKTIAKNSTRIIANSEKSAELFNDLNIGKKVQVIYNGLDPAEYDPTAVQSTLREELKLDPKKKIVAIAGSINSEKGHAEFIDAASQILEKNKDIIFLIVGDTERADQVYLGVLEEIIEKKQIQDNVLFLGYRNDIINVLAGVDIIVSASWRESFGRVIFEGMALEKPVIATSVGGVPEIIEDDITGMLIPHGDSSAIRNAVESLLVNPQKCVTLGKLARKRIQDRFSIQNHTEAIEKIYDGELGTK